MTNEDNRGVDINIDFFTSTITLTTKPENFEEFTEDFFACTQELFEHTEPMIEQDPKDVN